MYCRLPSVSRQEHWPRDSRAPVSPPAPRARCPPSPCPHSVFPYSCQPAPSYPLPSASCVRMCFRFTPSPITLIWSKTRRFCNWIFQRRLCFPWTDVFPGKLMVTLLMILPLAPHWRASFIILWTSSITSLFAFCHTENLSPLLRMIFVWFLTSNNLPWYWMHCFCF